MNQRFSNTRQRQQTYHKKGIIKDIFKEFLNVREKETAVITEESADLITDVIFKDYEKPRNIVDPSILEKNTRMQEANRVTGGKYVNLINDYSSGVISLEEVKNEYYFKESKPNAITFNDVRTLIAHSRLNFINLKPKLFPKNFRIYQDFNYVRSITPLKEIDNQLESILTTRPLFLASSSIRSPFRNHDIPSSPNHARRCKSQGKRESRDKNSILRNIDVKLDKGINAKNMTSVVDEHLINSKKYKISRPTTPGMESKNTKSRSRPGSRPRSRPSTAVVPVSRRTISSFGGYENSL